MKSSQMAEIIDVFFNGRAAKGTIGQIRLAYQTRPAGQGLLETKYFLQIWSCDRDNKEARWRTIPMVDVDKMTTEEVLQMSVDLGLNRPRDNK